VHQDPAFQRSEPAKIEHRQWEPFIGNERSVRRQHFLTVGASLHCSENALELSPHSPGAWASVFRQTHRFENP
jgi:hypothetical protein